MATDRLPLRSALQNHVIRRCHEACAGGYEGHRSLADTVKCATNLFYFEGVVQTTRSQFRACIQTERSENDDSACSVPFRDYYYYYYY